MAGNIRVLIVDDEESILFLLKRILSKDSIFEADTASRGYQAVALAQKRDYDALICDIDLPDMDGTEIVKELKLKQRCPPLVIFISGAVRSAPKNMVGNTFFVRKPFNPTEVISLLIMNARRK